MVSNKSLASMGYGLSGAIGAALAWPDRRTILIEGDGGFSQNLQEIGTAVLQQLYLKVLHLQRWRLRLDPHDPAKLFRRAGTSAAISGPGSGCPTGRRFSPPTASPRCHGPGFAHDPPFRALFLSPGVAAFLVRLDPEQTYFPKISSRVTASR